MQATTPMPTPAIGPTELAARCLAGAPSEVTMDSDQLVRLWARDVLRWCRFLANDGVHAEDACQEVLVVLSRNPPDVHDAQSVRRWLWGVTWRVVRAHRRRAWIRRWLPGRADTDMDCWPGAPGPSDTDRAVKTVLDRLRPEHRQLLWLAYAEGATRAELCEHLGVAEGTLNRRLTHARRAFDRAARRAGLGPDDASGRSDV